MSGLIDLDALTKTTVASAPFEHVLVPKFVPAAALAQVVADLPDIAAGGSFPTEAVRLGPAARALMAEMAGSALRHAIGEKFGLDLDGAPTMVTLRGRSREKDGRIHRDSDSKRVTVLLYLNPASADWASGGGSLRLLRNGEDIEAYDVEVPPTDGTLLVFPNGPATWHGHKRHVGRRYVVQLNYMTADARARRRTSAAQMVGVRETDDRGGEPSGRLMDAETIVRHYYASFNNPGGRNRMLSWLSDDVVHDISQGAREVGRTAFAHFMAHMDRCYEERVEDLVVMVDATGTRAAAEFTVHGRYLETDPGVPAATAPARGQTYVIPAGAFLTVRDDRIVRVATHYNLADWVRAVA